MKTSLASLCWIVGLTGGAQALAQQPTVELTESFLNRVIGGLGAMSDGGVSQPYNIAEVSPAYELCVPMGKIVCPELGPELPPGFGSNEIPLIACKKFGGGYVTLPVGEAVAWRWWVSKPRITLTANKMQFTATVTTRVDGQWHEETKTVNAALVYESATNALKLDVAPFSVQLVLPNSSASLGEPPVNVAKLYGISLPLAPQAFAVPLPNGGTRNVSGRINSMNATYLSGLARITLNVSL